MVDTRPTPPGFPNFFIIGAPKCGTTALSEYLRQHPHIGFSEPKEPHYFNDDFSSRHIYSLDDYMKCFPADAPTKAAVGEGSVFYLSSRTAVSNILRHAPEARFIVMLRNPVEAAYSWYWQAVHSFGEDIMEFEQAWIAQDDRAQGRRLPRYNKVREALQYGPLFKCGDQLERLYDTVPRQRVKVILFDEFKNDTNRIYLEVLEFLGVPRIELARYQVMNPGRRFRYASIEAVPRIMGNIKRKLGIEKGLGVLTRLKAWNTTHEKRPPLRASFRGHLKDYYRTDVLKAAKLIQRDLGAWAGG